MTDAAKSWHGFESDGKPISFKWSGRSLDIFKGPSDLAVEIDLDPRGRDGMKRSFGWCDPTCLARVYKTIALAVCDATGVSLAFRDDVVGVLEADAREEANHGERPATTEENAVIATVIRPLATLANNDRVRIVARTDNNVDPPRVWWLAMEFHGIGWRLAESPEGEDIQACDSLEELVEEIGDAFRYSLEKAKISEASLRETATRAEREAQSATARVAEIAAAQEAMRKALP